MVLLHDSKMSGAGTGDFNASSDQSQEVQQQIEAYIAWVNSQLKKRPGNKPVKNLATDFHDGTVLATLVEIISGERLQGIINPASDVQDKYHNINIVLKFLVSQNIRMHHIAEKDIVDGNVKSLMRLILTLAAHFKPASVGMKKTAAAAVNAAVAVGDLRRQVSNSGKFRDRWKSGSPSQSENRRFRRGISSPLPPRSISSPGTDPLSVNLFPSPSPKTSSKRNVDSPHQIISSPHTNQQTPSSENDSSDEYWNYTLQKQYDELDGELVNAKNLISVLQNLLLTGTIPKEGDDNQEEDVDGEEMQASNAPEQIIILQSKFDLCHHENEELKKELNKLRQEFRTSTASNSALRSRIQQQEKEMHSMKQRISKLNTDNDALDKEKATLCSQLDDSRRSKQSIMKDVAEKNTTIKQLKKELDHLSSQLRKLGDDSRDKLVCTQDLEIQVQELSHQLQILQKFSQSNRSQGEESSVIGESLASLRSSLPPQDSRQHIIDTLEQAVLSIPNHSRTLSKSDFSLSRANEILSSPTHSPRTRKREVTQKSSATTVIYFTDKNMTPVRATVQKKIGDITLRDFKGLLHHPGNFKYNFKALDPEFGTVKKEVFRDDEKVPGWEGKIVAWLEKDTS